jgi:hypothetical protein
MFNKIKEKLNKTWQFLIWLEEHRLKAMERSGRGWG